MCTTNNNKATATKTTTTTTTALLVITMAVLVHQLLSKQSSLFPHGLPVDLAASDYHSGPPMDPTNVSLRLSQGKLTKIYERVEEEGNSALLIGPETIIFDNDDIMYTLTEQAKLVSITDFMPKDDDSHSVTAKVTQVADLGIGRPLGGKFDNGSCLYYADVLKGLCRICLDKKPKPVVEIIASRFKLEDGSTYSDVTFADDVEIGPRTGHVYFSDATDIKENRDLASGLWDIFYPFKLALIRGKKSGRILRYKPENGEVDVIASDVALFANGVAVNAEESFVVFTSTFEGKVMKYHLTGEKEGQLETILTDFPAFLDGIDCSFDNPLCFVAMPFYGNANLEALFTIPPPLSRLIRSILMVIPRTWTPHGKHYGGVAVVHPVEGNIQRIYQDPTGSDISVITGVTEHNGKLYLGSLHNDFIGVLDY